MKAIGQWSHMEVKTFQIYEFGEPKGKSNLVNGYVKSYRWDEMNIKDLEGKVKL